LDKTISLKTIKTIASEKTKEDLGMEIRSIKRKKRMANSANK